MLAVLAIVLPAVALTAAVRRWVTQVPWSVSALMLGLVLVFLGSGLFSPTHVPVPVDEVVRGYPYKGIIGPVQPTNPLTNDTVKQLLPWMDEVRRQLGAGRLPLWNSYSFAGYPLLGNGQSAPFSPFFLVTLWVPLPKQLVAMSGLKLFAALLFMFVAARREGATTGGALAAAVVFGFSVFQTVYLYYPLTAVTALLPAAIVAVQRCFDRPGLGSAILTGAVGVAVLTGGHPESALHVVLAATLIVIIEVVARRAARGVGTAFVGAALGVGLSTLAWLPVAEQALYSARMHEIRGAGRDMTPTFPSSTAAALLHPDTFGHPARGDWHGFGNYSIVAPSYFGLVPLLVFVVAVVSSRNPRVWWFAAIALASFLVAMNWSALGRLINSLPLLSASANDRLRVVSVFFAALALGTGFSRALLQRWVLIGAGVPLVFLSALLGYRHVANTSIVAAYAPAAVLFILLVALFVRRSPGLVTRVAVVACCVELLILNVPFNALAELRYYKPTLPIMQRLHEMLRERPGRIVGFDWTLLPNASAHYQVEDIRGSDPMAPARYVEFFRLIEAADPYSDVKRVQDVNQPGLHFLNVRYLLTEPGQTVGAPWQLRYAGADGNLFENAAALLRFFAPEIAEPFDRARPLLDQLRGIADFRQRVIAANIQYPFPNRPGALQRLEVEQRSDTSFRIRTESKDPVFVASSMVATPGWRITLARQPVRMRMVNGAFLGFVAPAGRHEISVDYRPASVRIGAAVSAASAMLLVGMLNVRRRRAARACAQQS